MTGSLAGILQMEHDLLFLRELHVFHYEYADFVLHVASANLAVEVLDLLHFDA
jgi:hypothetical protein